MHGRHPAALSRRHDLCAEWRAAVVAVAPEDLTLIELDCLLATLRPARERVAARRAAPG